MGKINWLRLLLGGVLAGFVINVLATPLNVWEGGILEAEMERLGMERLGFGSAENASSVTLWGFLFWIVFGFVMGIGSVGVYVAILPRFGPGITTAVYAGLAVWFFFYLLTFTWLAQSAIFPVRYAAHVIATHSVLMCLATVGGAWVYRES